MNCPKCNTAMKLITTIIGKDGCVNRYHCSKCEHEWHAEAKSKAKRGDHKWFAHLSIDHLEKLLTEPEPKEQSHQFRTVRK